MNADASNIRRNKEIKASIVLVACRDEIFCIFIGDAPTLSIDDTNADAMSTETLEKLRDEIIVTAQSGSLAEELALDITKVKLDYFYCSIPRYTQLLIIIYR